MNISILTAGSIRFALSIIVAIVLLWILVRFRSSKNPRKNSLDILQERMEKGEITEREYEEAKKQQR